MAQTQKMIECCESHEVHKDENTDFVRIIRGRGVRV